MKQFFSLAIAVFIVSAAKAQINKGQWLVGGSAGFSYSNNRTDNSSDFSYKDKSTSLQIAPAAGYFIISKLAVGLRPGFSTMHDKVESHGNTIPFVYDAVSNSNSNGLTISPFVRYYFLPAKNKVNLLADFSYGYQHAKNTVKSTETSIDVNGQPTVISTNNEYKYNYSLFTLAAGPALFISQHVSLELLVGYTISKAKDPESTQHLLTASAGFQIHLGK